MVLLADDFGCAPVGRRLVQVSMVAGSANLAAADGTLRAIDVGKRIAVPGAADLVGVFAKLLNRKDVEHMSVTAGSTTLVAVFAPGKEPFRDDLHLGLRITVPGAGAGGAALVTDVVAVTNRTTLELADPAAATVIDGEAVLNRGDRIALSDYARATVTGVTVDLPGRVVVDAAMTIGQRGLVSPTAGFCLLDLEADVTVTGAGRLVTTIAAFNSETQVVLAVPAERKVDVGPADVWDPALDSRAGFEQLLAAIDGFDVGSVDIEFGAGVYDFTRPVLSTSPAGLLLDGLRNVRIRGAGMGLTVLRLMPDQDLHGPDTHVVMAQDCVNLTVSDLTVHGAYLTMAAANEQMHGIVVNEGCRDVVLNHVEVVQSAGDGVRLLGNVTEDAIKKVQRVWVTGCRLIQNKRTGIAFQRAVEFVWVRDCYVEMTPPSTDACIDFEPTGRSAGSAPTDVLLDGNVLVHGTPAVAVSLSGIRGTDPAHRIRFTNNTLHGGGIGGVHARDVTISGNTIVAGQTGQVAVFRGNVDGLRIQDNTIVARDGERDGIRLASLDGFRPSDVRITGNDIEAARVGISVVDPGSHVEIAGNRILGRRLGPGIIVNLPRPPDDEPDPDIEVHRDFRIVGNTLTDFGEAAIRLATGNTLRRYDGVQVSSNQIQIVAALGAATLVGIQIVAPGSGQDRWIENALFSDNRMSAAIGVGFQRPTATVPFVAVAGNPGHRAMFEGDGEPEEVGASAIPGSLYFRVDTTPVGLYLKATGTDAAGWVRLATDA